MAKTLAGVYHDIKESEFVVTDGELYIFFSSSAKMKKFLSGYEAFRKTMSRKYEKLMNEPMKINQDVVFDLMFYKNVESKGFYCILNGKEITEESEEFKEYIIKKADEENSPVYKGVFLINGNKDILENGEGEIGENEEQQPK